MKYFIEKIVEEKNRGGKRTRYDLRVKLPNLDKVPITCGILSFNSVHEIKEFNIQIAQEIEKLS